MLCRIEILDLSGNLDRQVFCRECLYEINTAYPVQQILPEIRNIVSDR